ncbi:MAG TPA: YdcF family protein [Bryobacteraceae bacterium]|nr:YdcF family protein [Bryobacteraceae bacterium]
MSPFRRFTQWFLLALLLVFLLLSFNYRTVLAAIGDQLVETRPPERADAVLVLAGDFRGTRILRGGELAQGGFAPTVLVSGPAEVYGVNEATLAIQYATSRGMPPNYFQAVPIRAFSTLEEAHAFAPELRKRNIRKLLLVTSNYHTHRAANIFRAVLGKDIAIHSVAAADPYFRPESWWHNREGQKIVFYEYSKMIAGWLGM